MKKKTKRTIGILSSLSLVGIIAIVSYAYTLLYAGFDIDKTVYIYVGSNADYNSVEHDVYTIAKVKNPSAFKQIASLLKYPSQIKVGRYAVKPDMTVFELVRHLRAGSQTPVSLQFNNIRTKEALSDRIGEQLMLSSDSLLSLFNDSLCCQQLGFTPQTIVALFIPNTYQIYWDIQPKNLIAKMLVEYKKFWNADRLAKAEAIHLSPVEVSTLASIVEEECTYTDEYPVVAGLYLNRLHIGQALQADPTVKFAVGDFSLRRILGVHLQIESPYNTYRHAGLPLGPIRVSSIQGIDGVLNYAQHNYYYMCAKEDFSGRHNFAVSYTDHQRNAAKYRKALDARGIK